MSKITDANRELFKKEAAKYQKVIDEVLEKEKSMLTVMKDESIGVEYKKLILCEEMIFIATLYNAINSSSLKILEVKNNDALNDARKILYKAIIYLEEVVSNVISIPASDMTDKMEAIKNTPVEKRYYLVRKLGLAIQMIVDAFGDNSKWKWSFVELEGRYATVAKNLLDMKNAAKDYFDPNSSAYETTVTYIRLIQKLLDKSATAYRDKYELSTRRIDDMKAGINYLLALRRIAMALGQTEEADEFKRKAVTWNDKMESDHKSGKSN